MQKDILKFIKSQGSIFSAAKFFGGIGSLLKYTKNNTQLYNNILELCSGEISFVSDSKNKHEFDIIVTNIDKENLDDEIDAIYVFVDLQVKNIEKEYEIGQWVQSYMDDLRVYFYFKDKELKKFSHIYGTVSSINGNLYDIERGVEIIPDKEIEPFLNENILTYIQKLQNLFD
jgi:hypothetical protein